MSWISDAQNSAVLLLSSAAQRPDAEALAALQAIPPEAWGCSERLADAAKLLQVAMTLPPEERGPHAEFVLAEVGHDGDPWKIEEYAKRLKSLSGAYHAATRTLPREADSEPEKDKPPALPPFADLSGIWDLAEAEVPMLFTDSMPLGELSLIASEPGVGKTTLVIGLGLSVALGRGFIAGFAPQRRGRVALLLAEDGPIPVAKRIRSWCEAAGVSRSELEKALTEGQLSIVCGESAALLDFSTGGLCRRTLAYSELAAKCEAGRYDLLVVDSLIEWAGVPSENDNTAVQQAAKALIDLAKASGGAVVALAHTNKLSDRNGAVGLHAIRGGSALAGKIRWGAMLSHLGEDDLKAFSIAENDRWRYVRLDVVKSQYAERCGAPVYLERGDGGAMEAVRLTKPGPKDRLMPLAEALAERLGDNPDGISKWHLIHKKPGADFRADLKLYYGSEATTRNIGLAYDLAVQRGLIIEENAEQDGGGKVAIIPRRANVKCFPYAD